MKVRLGRPKMCLVEKSAQSILSKVWLKWESLTTRRERELSGRGSIVPIFVTLYHHSLPAPIIYIITFFEPVKPEEPTLSIIYPFFINFLCYLMPPCLGQSFLLLVCTMKANHQVKCSGNSNLPAHISSLTIQYTEHFKQFSL